MSDPKTNPAGTGGTGSTVASSKPAKSDSPPVPERPLDMSMPSDEDVEALNTLARKIAYDGFNTVKIRTKAVNTIPPKDLLEFLTAAAQVGNNMDRLSGKIKDKEAGKDLINKLGLRKVRTKGATGSEDLTLARLATAFAPLYYAVRVQVKDALQDQGLGTGLSKEFQSPSLAVYSDRNDALLAWLVAFGRQIRPKSEDIAITDARTKAFANLAVANRKDDSYLNTENFSKSIKELLKLAYTPPK
jgi:hypothetical protein